MTSSSNEYIVDCFDIDNDNLIDWFDIEINETVNSNDKEVNHDNHENQDDDEHDYHMIEDLVDDYDLLQILNESSSNLSDKKKIINKTINTAFLIENKPEIDENPQELKHFIINIPESECYEEKEQITEQIQEQITEQIQEIINNEDDVKEYQNDLYNYLNLKYYSLLNRINVIYNYIFDRPYMHRFGNTINNLYNRVYFFFENNINMIYNLGVYFGVYGFVRIGYNLIIRNQYRYIRNFIRNVRYYLYNVFS